MIGRAFCVAAACLVTSVEAKAEQRHDFNIPRGTLRDTVLVVGQQANVSISLQDSSLYRVRVGPVRGRMTVPQALRRLLSGTPATFLSLGDSTYRIVRAPAQRRRLRRAEPPSSPIPGTMPPPAPRPDPQEIIVTGSKRETPLRNYPGPAVVLVGSDFGPADAEEGTAAIMSRIASLGSTHLGTGRNKLFVRGIADSSFNGPTQSTVAQYFGEARVNYSAPDPDLRLYDIAAVELLPGPQGTLYGAGSMGGVLRIVPKAPDRDRAHVAAVSSLSMTEHGKPGGEVAGIFNVPVVAGQIAVRGVGYLIREGGYIDDVGIGETDVNRTEINGARAVISASIGDGWEVEAGALAQRIEGKGSQYASRAQSPLTRRSHVPQPFSNDYSLVHMTIRGDWGGYRLTTAASAVGQDVAEDFDAAELSEQVRVFRQRNRAQLYSLETRLSREWKSGGGWLAGVSVLQNHSRLTRAAGAPGMLEPLPGVENKLDEQTMFAEITQPLSQALQLTGGLRLSHVGFEGLSTAPPTVGSDSSRVSGDRWRLLPSLALSVTLRSDVQAFLRYHESFRPGGAVVRTNATHRLDSDYIRGIEAGVRAGQDRVSRVRGSASVNYSRWTDLQADFIDPTGLPTTVNLGNAEVWSLDGDISWRPLRNFRLLFSAVANHTRLLEFGPSISGLGDYGTEGARLPNVPDFAATAAGEYSRPLGSHELQFSARARYTGASRVGVGPVLGREQGNYLDTEFNVRLRSSNWELFALATNLLGERGNRFALGSVLRTDPQDPITPLRPRSIRVGFSIRS